MSTYALLNIRESEPADTKNFVQDIILTATTFIWTVVVISLIVSWLLLVFAWADEKLAQKWKNWIKFSLIWLVIVLFSYVIIQIIQYIARWW
jgi:heme/copper-type cytochrome/quinol oxidase subunit 2